MRAEGVSAPNPPERTVNPMFSIIKYWRNLDKAEKAILFAFVAALAFLYVSLVTA